MITPFHTSEGEIQFPWKPTADRAFIFPSPPPETFIEGGVIRIPETLQLDYRKGYGVLLAVGPGFYNKKGRWCPTLPELSPGCHIYYDVTVPWREVVIGVDGKEHVVVFCGASDIMAVGK